MSQGRTLPHLVAYDIADPRRSDRIRKLLKAVGIPMQYSVFLCFLNEPAREKLAYELERLIEPRQDDVRIYPLPASPWHRRWGRDAIPLEHQLLGIDDGGLLTQGMNADSFDLDALLEEDEEDDG